MRGVPRLTVLWPRNSFLNLWLKGHRLYYTSVIYPNEPKNVRAYRRKLWRQYYGRA